MRTCCICPQVIVLDTDLIFSADIGELWQMFRLFTTKQVGVGDIDMLELCQPMIADQSFSSVHSILQTSFWRIVA